MATSNAPPNNRSANGTMLASGRMPASRSTSAGNARTASSTVCAGSIGPVSRVRAAASASRPALALRRATLLLLDRLLEQLQRLPLADAAPRRQYRELAGARGRVALLPVVDRLGADADEPAEF